MARGRVAVVLAGALLLAACSTELDDASVVSVAPEFTTDLTAGDASAEGIVSVSSPDNALRIDAGVVDGAPVYRVVRVIDGDEVAVLGRSALGLETSRGSLASDLVLADEGEVTSWSDDFSLPTGKARTASIEGRLRTIRFEAVQSAGLDVALEVDLLATDHAVAHRSRVVADSRNEPPTDAEVRIDWERTSFAVAPTSRAWLQNHDRNSFGSPAYEQRRSSGRDVSNPIASPEGWTLPALFEGDATWTLVTEAGLDAGGAASHLGESTTSGEFVLALPSRFDGNGIGAVEPRGALPFTTPWRVVVNSPNLGDIVETDIVRHLSTPGPSLDWVEPGVASWSWWSNQGSPRDPAAMEPFIDLAAEFGWPYFLVDANWNEIEPEAFTDLVDFAAARNVRLLLWYNSGGPNNSVAEAPRGLMTDREVRRAEMERIATLGIAGIKVDFFHSDKPAGIQQYLDILQDAADFELLVVFHGNTVPRGWSRTWPNLMTSEAVLGGEQYIFNPGFSALAPAQNTVLPFTRNVVGSMDFTPMAFGGGYSRRTSNGHELALSVVFESGVQHFVGTPEAFRAQPAAVQQALRDVPTVWDETKYLAGRPDEHVVLARRNADQWWVGAINGTNDALTVKFDPADIDAAGRSAEVICDGADKGSYDIAEVVLGVPIDLVMLDEGGCLIRID